MKGIKRSAFSLPICSITISSLTNKIIGSSKDCIPVGIEGFPLYFLAAGMNNASIIRTLIHIDATLRVILRSNGLTFSGIPFSFKFIFPVASVTYILSL